MPWDRSAIFREQISSALAPRPGWRARSGWNLPVRPPVPGTPPEYLVTEFRCCLFGDNIDTGPWTPPDPPFPPGSPAQPAAEAANGGDSGLNPGGNPPGNPNATSRWRLDQSLPAGNPTAWPTGGRPIPGTGQRPTAAGPPGFQATGSVITFGGDNVTSNGRITMNDIHGDLVFDFGSNTNNEADLILYQGVCFHYFGGPAGVTDGTFTVVWPAERVAQVQLAGISPSPPR